ncbi:two-component response regulator [Methanosarcina horonobensis HB-1 = JCM 15518]|uniref:Two-component response regulator n=1 Tax=Methanosarcina horonobensis HB-1 = JCM 15518 TaxID=1434110 RepID=A0A0E3SCR5_9EURY
MKVLIAEDEPISNLYLKNTLVRWGYEVVSTKNGSEAWEVLRGSNPQWIAILDWEMPKMKGIEVCQKIRADSRISTGTYVILITGRDLDEDIEMGFKAGADDYLKKPFNNQILKAKLETARRALNL